MLMVLDCMDSGLANVDMEYINILLGTLKSYYPESLQYILIYEMQWIMNGKQREEFSRANVRAFDSTTKSSSNDLDFPIRV